MRFRFCWNFSGKIKREDKPKLLLLLACLAKGSRRPAQIRSPLEAVRRGIPLFVNHLSHFDPEVRACASHLLGQCQDDTVSVPLVRRLDVETDPKVVATSIIFALSDIGQGDRSAFLSYLDDSDFGVRFAAAVFTAKGAFGIVPSKAINLSC